MGSCGTTCGITRAREREKALARSLARHVWPEGRGGDPAWMPDDPPWSLDEARSLAAGFESILPARGVVVEPAREDLATFVYVAATVADATWVALREGLEDCVPEAPEERGLRVGLSPFGRFATLQEYVLSAERVGEGLCLLERRVAGVEDRRFQTFVKALQGALRHARFTTLDAAFLAEPWGEATLWSALFEEDAPVTSVAVYLPVPQGDLITGAQVRPSARHALRCDD